MQPVCALAGCVLLEHAGVGNTQLSSQMRRDRPRHLARVGQERAEEPHSANLDGEPETVVLTSANFHELPSGGV